MKKINIYISFLLLSFFGIFSCSLDENPNFLSSVNLFEDVSGAEIALNGVYGSLNDYGYYTSEYHHVLNWTSGMYNSNRDGSLLDIAALNPSPNDKFIGNLWAAVFRTISRANNVILQLEDKDLGDPEERDKLLGQALFLRAQAYFDLVRVFGRVPLITSLLDSDSPSVGLSSSEEIYTQIQLDAERAATLMPDFGENEAGKPAKYAANMLLAKLYMWMAGDSNAGESDLWQKAYDEASKLYGKYSLVDDYGDLWQDESRDNTVESIFEVQGNVESNLRLVKYWSASNAHVGRTTWARFKPNLEVYDRHLSAYPDDPRIPHTFRTEFNKYASNGSTTVQITYPTFTNRGNRDKSYPYGNKYFIRNEQLVNTDSDMNYVVYRYADLLLMLAEIENELNGPDGAYQYVNEVLTRARNSSDTTVQSPANWESMSQDEFRDAITHEYFYELQQEGQDFFNVRRRGWNFFREFAIIPHNSHPLYDFSNKRDVEFQDNERIMLLPIPELEIGTNSEIGFEDQNPGW